MAILTAIVLAASSLVATDDIKVTPKMCAELKTLWAEYEKNALSDAEFVTKMRRTLSGVPQQVPICKGSTFSLGNGYCLYWNSVEQLHERSPNVDKEFVVSDVRIDENLKPSHRPSFTFPDGKTGCVTVPQWRDAVETLPESMQDQSVIVFILKERAFVVEPSGYFAFGRGRGSRDPKPRVTPKMVTGLKTLWADYEKGKMRDDEFLKQMKQILVDVPLVGTPLHPLYFFGDRNVLVTGPVGLDGNPRPDPEQVEVISFRDPNERLRTDLSFAAGKTGCLAVTAKGDIIEQVPEPTSESPFLLFVLKKHVVAIGPFSGDVIGRGEFVGDSEN